MKQIQDKEIGDIIDLILSDYDDDRSVNKIDISNQPDREAIIDVVEKLLKIEYLSRNQKTQILTPTLMGEMVYDVVDAAIKPLLNPALTASWEKGLTQVADSTITAQEYMGKLSDFVVRRTNYVKQMNNQGNLYAKFQAAAVNYTRERN